MTAFKTDLTNEPTTRLLTMFVDMVSDNGGFRSHLNVKFLRENTNISAAYNELRAEIDRRVPVPGAKPRMTTGVVLPGFPQAMREALTKRDVIAFVRSIPSRTKHGPAGLGDAGPCDPGCLKCEAEALVARFDVQAGKELGDHPRCREQGTCEDVDGSGSCFGCGRWLEDEMKPIRSRVRVAVIDLLHALDEKDLGILPPDSFDRELDAIIRAAKGL